MWTGGKLVIKKGNWKRREKREEKRIENREKKRRSKAVLTQSLPPACFQR